MRLIDADALDEVVLNLNTNRDLGFTRVDYKLIDSVLFEFPTIDERKTGKWIKMTDADGVYWSCSECGEDIPRIAHFTPQFDLFPRLESIDKTNFCPSCGADMRGEENG